MDNFRTKILQHGMPVEVKAKEIQQNNMSQNNNNNNSNNNNKANRFSYAIK